ncbi:YjaG family protein [Neptunicella marina]|uniref:YjaG family protein n=1 Tax=Neptunicella marina TaxID=2125989 RepID=A0A8J6LY46_9ALTE|nr:YjaG family protein [Neptunicella marina]MBC3766014.1 YjaG family protein [Neptunicella marina]
MNNKLTTFARVRELPPAQAALFGATLLERMLPNYMLFCDVSEQGDAEQFRKTLNAIWDKLADPKQKMNLAVHLEKIEEATPDAAEHDFYGVYPAIDAGMSMAALLLLIMGDDPQGAVVISKLSQGSVEAFIEATHEEQLDNQAIKAHPLMQWEVSFQQSLLDILESKKTSPNLCKELRAMAVEEGVSNIGIEIQE